MNARSLRLLPFLLAAVPAAHAASYPIFHLEPNDALMALGTRIPELTQDCHVGSRRASDSQRAGMIGVLDISCGTDAVQAKIKPALEAIDTPPPTYRFHVAVLSATRKDGPEPQLPASELKALDDFKKVMSFKSFQVEAETILQSDRSAVTQLGANFALDLSVDRNNVGADSINVQSFKLRSATMQATPTGDKNFFPTYIETSFSIKRGETLVLGNSTSDQQARVVLVTALP
jgi:hypothetical protein